jgi:hypothetical protein
MKKIHYGWIIRSKAHVVKFHLQSLATCHKLSSKYLPHTWMRIWPHHNKTHHTPCCNYNALCSNDRCSSVHYGCFIVHGEFYCIVTKFSSMYENDILITTCNKSQGLASGILPHVFYFIWFIYNVYFFYLSCPFILGKRKIC